MPIKDVAILLAIRLLHRSYRVSLCLWLKLTVFHRLRGLKNHFCHTFRNRYHAAIWPCDISPMCLKPFEAVLRMENGLDLTIIAAIMT